MPGRGPPPAHASFPNLAPMIDVVMVILIFFMLGTSFATSEGALRSQLPAQVGPGGGARIQFVPAVRVDLQPEEGGTGCRVIVMGQQLSDRSFAALTSFLAARVSQGADPTGRVLISADPRLRYQHVISAMDACLRAGFVNVQFAVNRAPASLPRPG